MKSDADAAAAARDGDERAALLLPVVARHERDAAVALYRAHVSREEQRAGVDAAAEAVLRVHRVVWTHKQLRYSGVVEVFLNVTHVYLSHNELHELDGLQLLMQLRVLVVAHNALVSTRAVALLPELYYLDVQHNRIAQLDAAVDLPCATLRCLYMDANPCCIHVSSTDGGEMATAQTRTQHDDDEDNDADDKRDARTRLARHVRAVCGDMLEYLDLEHTGNTPREAATALEDSDVDDDDNDVHSDGVATAKTASLLLLHNDNDDEGEEDEYHDKDAAAALYVPHTRRRLQHVRQVDAHYRRCYGGTVPRVMPASILAPANNNKDGKLNRNDDSSRSSSNSSSSSEAHEERVDDGACRCVRDETAYLTATTPTQWRGDAERLWQQYATRAASRCALVLRHAAQHNGTDNDDDNDSDDDDDDGKNGNRSSRTSGRDDHHDNGDEYAARAHTRQFAPLTVDDHDALVEARRLQSSMYADVTCAMRQHDAQARRALAAQWASVERVMQTSHGVAAERRRCQHAASMTQSSSYADALRLLAGESLRKDIRAYDGTTREART